MADEQRQRDGDFNYGRSSNPKFDTIVAQTETEMNAEKRLALIRLALEIHNAEIPHILLHPGVALAIGVSWSKVRPCATGQVGTDLMPVTRAFR